MEKKSQALRDNSPLRIDTQQYNWMLTSSDDDIINFLRNDNLNTLFTIIDSFPNLKKRISRALSSLPVQDPLIQLFKSKFIFPNIDPRYLLNEITLTNLVTSYAKINSDSLIYKKIKNAVSNSLLAYKRGDKLVVELLDTLINSGIDGVKKYSEYILQQAGFLQAVNARKVDVNHLIQEGEFDQIAEEFDLVIEACKANDEVKSILTNRIIQSIDPSNKNLPPSLSLIKVLISSGVLDFDEIFAKYDDNWQAVCDFDSKRNRRSVFSSLPQRWELEILECSNATNNVDYQDFKKLFMSSTGSILTISQKTLGDSTGVVPIYISRMFSNLKNIPPQLLEYCIYNNNDIQNELNQDYVFMGILANNSVDISIEQARQIISERSGLARTRAISNLVSRNDELAKQILREYLFDNGILLTQSANFIQSILSSGYSMKLTRSFSEEEMNTILKDASLYWQRGPAYKSKTTPPRGRTDTGIFSQRTGYNMTYYSPDAVMARMYKNARRAQGQKDSASLFTNIPINIIIEILCGIGADDYKKWMRYARAINEDAMVIKMLLNSQLPSTEEEAWRRIIMLNSAKELMSYMPNNGTNYETDLDAVSGDSTSKFKLSSINKFIGWFKYAQNIESRKELAKQIVDKYIDNGDWRSLIISILMEIRKVDSSFILSKESKEIYGFTQISDSELEKFNPGMPIIYSILNIVEELLNLADQYGISIDYLENIDEVSNIPMNIYEELSPEEQEIINNKEMQEEDERKQRVDLYHNSDEKRLLDLKSQAETIARNIAMQSYTKESMDLFRKFMNWIGNANEFQISRVIDHMTSSGTIIAPVKSKKRKKKIKKL